MEVAQDIAGLFRLLVSQSCNGEKKLRERLEVVTLERRLA
jgi:septum formation topological specificity factor MinE